VTAGTQTGCVFSNNEYTQEIIVEYASPPAAGMLDVNGQQFAITGSPQSVVLTGLNSDGMDVDVTVFFTDSVACTATIPALYTAPDSCPLNGSFVINEVDAATPGFDQAEFIEIIGPPNAPLDGLVIVLFNGNNDLSYAAFDLDGFTLDANGFFVLGNAGVPNVDMIIGDNTIQNGADGVGLYFGDAIDFPNNTPATGTNLIDALVYDSGQPDDATLLGILTPGQSQINEDGNGMFDSHSSSRVPDGGTPLNTSTYVAQQPTPGETNIPCSITDIAAGTQTPCDLGTSVYTQTLTITYVSSPSSGTLDVNGQSFPITSSPQDVVLTGLPADGMPVDVTASFSDNVACTLTENAVFTAPTCTCDISAIAVEPQTACDDIGGTYDIEVTVTYEYAPSSGTLDVNGQSFAITSSPQTVVLTGMPLDGQSVDLTASFSDDGACTFTETGAYTAPSVCGCIITNIAAGAQTSCDPLTNEYTQEVIVTYFDAPITGTLVVNGQFFAIGSSPQIVVLTGLDSDGMDVDVSANFSDDPTCSASEMALFTAPAACPCAIDNVTAGTQSACDGGTNEYTQDITVEYTNGSTTGTLDANGQSFAISGSPQTITLVGLIADGNDVDVSVSFSDNGACSATETALFTAPISCEPPANDICENAIPVACGGSAPGNTTAATLDNNAAAVACGSPFAISVTAPGVWYEVVGTGGNITLGVCDADYDTKMSILEGRCDSLVCTGAIDDGCNSFRSQFNLASELNKTYYVLVHGFGSATGTFNFTVDCDSLCIDSMTSESGTCVGSTYSQDVTIYYSLPPTTGNLSVNGQLFSILGSPQTVTLTGTVDGNPVDVDAFFTDQPICILSEPALFTPCTCPNITTIPATPGVYTADLEYTDAMGWTHYYDTGNNLLLLSIEKNGENIGSIGDVGFEVEVEVLAGYASGMGIDLSTAPYVTNPDGWFVMNRYWDVTPVNQPSSSVFIRTYYTDDDFTDVQGSVSNAGKSISTHPELTFYKIGTNFDPSPAIGHSAVGPADYAEPAWTYSAFNSVDHYAEYPVASFSGGGGGSGGGGKGAFEANSDSSSIEGCSFVSSGDSSYKYLYRYDGAGTIDSIRWEISPSNAGVIEVLPNQDSIWIEFVSLIDTTVILYAISSDICGEDTLAYPIKLDTDYVYPGDVNLDGRLNLLDIQIFQGELLRREHLYGAPYTDSARIQCPSDSLPHSWYPQAAEPWNQQMHFGEIDVKHLDIDGNGIVTNNTSYYNPSGSSIPGSDVEWLILNFYRGQKLPMGEFRSPPRRNFRTSPPSDFLYIEISDSITRIGDTIEMKAVVKLGSEGDSIEINSIAFNTKVQFGSSESIVPTYQNSYFGTPGSNMSAINFRNNDSSFITVLNRHDTRLFSGQTICELECYIVITPVEGRGEEAFIPRLVFEDIAVLTDSGEVVLLEDVAIDLCGKDPFEDNDRISDAANLPLVGIKKNARICPLNDEDWYKIDIDSNDRNIEAHLSDVIFDCELGLYDAQENLIHTAIASDSLPAIIRGNDLAVAPYYLKVNAVNDDFSHTHPYSLHVQRRNTPFTSSSPIRETANLPDCPSWDGSPCKGKSGEIVWAGEGTALDAHISVYPNPTTGELTIEYLGWDKEEQWRIQVFDAVGKLVYRESTVVDALSNSYTLDLGDLVEGVYFLTVKIGDKDIRRKVIRN